MRGICEGEYVRGSVWGVCEGMCKGECVGECEGETSSNHIDK